MNTVSILCPVDFSEPSHAALCYAAAVADHFGALLTVLAVDDPLLAEVAAGRGSVPSLEHETREELRRFAGEALGHMGPGPRVVDYRVSVGKPAAEILGVANDVGADLIVMSTRGRSGVRKMFFGSTTERVLRETPIPVLVTPDDGPHRLSVSDLARLLRRVLVPVDLSPSSAHQVAIGAGLAEALSVPVVLLHVMEPVYIPPRVRLVTPGLDAARRAEVDDQLAALAARHSGHVTVEPVVVAGDPSEEIAKLADVRDTQIIVMGLHSSGALGPRMGSVTYRLLCLTRALVLAIPPKPAASWHQRETANGVKAIA